MSNTKKKTAEMKPADKPTKGAKAMAEYRAKGRPLLTHVPAKGGVTVPSAVLRTGRQIGKSNTLKAVVDMALRNPLHNPAGVTAKQLGTKHRFLTAAEQRWRLMNPDAPWHTRVSQWIPLQAKWSFPEESRGNAVRITYRVEMGAPSLDGEIKLQNGSTIKTGGKGGGKIRGLKDYGQ